MKRRNMKKSYILVGVLLLVAGITLGFAAFSNTLTIQSSATVTPDSENFKVRFSSNSESLETNPIEPSYDESITQVTNAIIDSDSNITISNISVLFTDYDNVRYDFYVRNDGEYDAYLNEVIFNNVEGKNKFKVCEVQERENANDQATDSLVQTACDNTVFQIRVSGSETHTGLLTDTTKISNHILKKGDSKSVKVFIKHSTDVGEADGPYNILFGDITLKYSTVDVNKTESTETNE